MGVMKRILDDSLSIFNSSNKIPVSMNAIENNNKNCIPKYKQQIMLSYYGLLD